MYNHYKIFPNSHFVKCLQSYDILNDIEEKRNNENNDTSLFFYLFYFIILIVKKRCQITWMKVIILMVTVGRAYITKSG